MPDENKLKVLAENGYEVRRVCGNCTHVKGPPASSWASCSIKTYEHAKHGKKLLSVNRAGTCRDHSLRAYDERDLERSGFTRFIEEEPFRDDPDHGVGMLSH